VARLQTPVSSAVAAPVVAVIEYNYERNGQIVLAAGSKVFAAADAGESVGLRGHSIQPGGDARWNDRKIDASAMSLNFGPLKGDVSGKKTGTKCRRLASTERFTPGRCAVSVPHD